MPFYALFHRICALDWLIVMVWTPLSTDQKFGNEEKKGEKRVLPTETLVEHQLLLGIKACRAPPWGFFTRSTRLCGQQSRAGFAIW